MATFHRGLGDDTVRLRYLHSFGLDQRTAHGRLLRVCFTDYDREMTLVAEHLPATSEREIVAIGRLSRDRGSGRAAEVALLVSDSWQSKGIGHELLDRLIQIGRAEGLSTIRADILGRNTRMQRLCARLGFFLRTDDGGGMVSAVLDLHGR